ncbi:hypothetical protein DL546_002398 [Coniochaeta pulveracea]|nr:hypothetical protein DL546_002398 [Coniochaeta pulveracea]
MSAAPSNNPFLDPSSARAPQTKRLNEKMSNNPYTGRKSPTAVDLFDELTLEDKQRPAVGNAPPRPDAPKPSAMNKPRGHENGPPHARRGPPRHRPSGSQEDAPRMRMPPSIHDANKSPQKRVDPRRRRNSESSVMDDLKVPLADKERRGKESNRQDRKDRDGKKPTSRKFDVIDAFDESMKLFGSGVKIHHDGPYDACNPHRNRQGSRRAPMQAFAKDSLNNTIGGSGPLNKRPDHATFMGHAEDEAFMDYSTGKKERSGSSSFADIQRGKGSGMPVFDPTSRGSVLHGDETLGLGTSTFLEGTPAARTDIQRREKERAEAVMDGGLTRKKSLAQRIRGMNRPQQGFAPSGRLTNPEGAYGSRRTPSGTYMTSASMTSPKDERNPFFEEFHKGEELISVRNTNAEPRSPDGPEQNLRLERRATAEGSAHDEPRQGGGGLLARVKSLKGGRRVRPAPPSQYPGPPGQAV